MSFEFYEVWGRDEDGHEELFETTRVKKQAFELAKQCLAEGYVVSMVYQENENGELDEIQQFEQT